MKRQNDRIKNILKVKTDNLKSAEKRLADAMSKKRTVAAEKMRSGKTKSREELRSGLMMDLDIKVRTNEAKHAIEVFKKERSNLAKDERRLRPRCQKGKPAPPVAKEERRAWGDAGARYGIRNRLRTSGL